MTNISLQSLASFAVLPPCPPAENVWVPVFLALTSSGTHTACDFDRLDLFYRRALLTEVIRREWDSRFPKVTGLGRQGAKEVKAAGLVAHKVLKLIAKIQLRDPALLDNKHPSEWFGRLIAERESIGYIVLSGAGGAAKFKRRLGSDTQKIYTLTENPFTRPHTKRLFDIALTLAMENDGFVAPLREYAQARRELLKIFKEGSGTKVVTKSADGKPKRCRQGRAKKS